MVDRQYMDVVDFCEVSCLGKFHTVHLSKHCRDIENIDLNTK